MSDKKLIRKFRKYINKYQHWCIEIGCTSSLTINLLRFFNQPKYKMAYRNDGSYFILYQDVAYNVNDLIEFFKL